MGGGLASSGDAKISTQPPEDADRIITRQNNNHKRSIKRAADSTSLASIQSRGVTAGASGTAAASPIHRSASLSRGRKVALSAGVVVNAIWTSIAAHSANSFQFVVGERRKGTEVKKYERESTLLP